MDNLNKHFATVNTPGLGFVVTGTTERLRAVALRNGVSLTLFSSHPGKRPYPKLVGTIESDGTVVIL